MTLRGVVSILLVSVMGLTGCGEDWSAEPEPPTQAELAQARQDQLDERLGELRAAELEGWTVEPISEPIVQDWLTTSIGPLYLDGGLCTDVTMESRSAVPVRVHAKDWTFVTPDNPGVQGRIWDGDDYVRQDVRGSVVISPRGRREFQVCATNLNVAKKLTYPPPPGIYEIAHQAPVGDSYRTTHVWITVL
ncbi:hypothetical protein [Dietzia sp. 179-F 9C3 NHS]|uniref:hypothetical protein n=1 Tax=Dietzia sp. 179-F 9C3 NHS TaxID=3374295 RepID=UPI00387A52D6